MSDKKNLPHLRQSGCTRASSLLFEPLSGRGSSSLAQGRLRHPGRRPAGGGGEGAGRRRANRSNRRRLRPCGFRSVHRLPCEEPGEDSTPPQGHDRQSQEEPNLQDRSSRRLLTISLPGQNFSRCRLIALSPCAQDPVKGERMDAPSPQAISPQTIRRRACQAKALPL